MSRARSQSIDVTMNVTSDKADEMCGYIVGFKSDLQLKFDAQWKVKIFPVSNGKTPMAECGLS